MAKTDYNSINFKNKDVDRFATKFNKTPEPPKKTEGQTASNSKKDPEFVKNFQTQNLYRLKPSDKDQAGTPYVYVSNEKGRDAFMGERGFKKTKEGNYINSKGEYGTPPAARKGGAAGEVNIKAQKKVVETISKNVKSK